MERERGMEFSIYFIQWHNWYWCQQIPCVVSARKTMVSPLTSGFAETVELVVLFCLPLFVSGERKWSGSNWPFSMGTIVVKNMFNSFPFSNLFFLFLLFFLPLFLPFLFLFLSPSSPPSQPHSLPPSLRLGDSCFVPTCSLFWLSSSQWTKGSDLFRSGMQTSDINTCPMISAK